MIRTILKKTGLLVYAQHIREKYFPVKSQLRERNAVTGRMAFYKQFVGKGDLCFDVGANIGNRTNVFLALGAKVVAVEPQSQCAKRLKLRFGNKIVLINKALGEKEDEATMYIGDSSALSSLSKEWIDAVAATRFKGTEDWSTTEHVKITTLNKIIETHGIPKFCKIDVEGYEEEVLKGLSVRIPYLSFEFAVPEKLSGISRCFAQLQRIGKFDCNYAVGEDMDLKLSTWVSADEVLAIIEKFDQQAFGDIYIRFSN